jgi:hypothetical protein
LLAGIVNVWYKFLLEIYPEVVASRTLKLQLTGNIYYQAMVYVCMVLLVKCYVQIMAETDLVFKFMIIL